MDGGKVMRHLESDIQIACVRWFRYQHPKLARLLFAVPNGGARNAVTASILKAEGVVAGVADLLLLIPKKGYAYLAIEMKKVGGRVSDSQKAFQQAVERFKGKYVVCYSLEEFQAVVTEYLE